MTIEAIKEKVKTDKEYEFLKTDKRLDKNIICLGLGGSYAYGTNVETSDIDIRGVALNSKQNILLGRDFEQVVETVTDTTIYSVNKIFKLLMVCNPNIIEILGLSDDQMIYTTPVWEKIVKNKDLFLSKRCIQSFGGYANAQLRRLETKSARLTGQAQREKYILGSIENASIDFKERYAKISSDDINLHIEESEKEDFETEIMCDIHVTNYPLRDLTALMNDYHAVVRDYDKIGKRNKHAIEHDKLGKHAMHLVRLYYMLFDILEKGIVKTYRDEEHDMLMSIRNGVLFEEDGVTPKQEFYDLVDSLEARMQKAKETTALPDEPDYEALNKLLAEINEEVVLNTRY